MASLEEKSSTCCNGVRRLQACRDANKACCTAFAFFLVPASALIIVSDCGADDNAPALHFCTHVVHFVDVTWIIMQTCT